MDKSAGDNKRKIINQIGDMNMEIILFLEKLKDFQKHTNIMDGSLFSNLENLIETVEKFLDSDPARLDTNSETKFDINLNQQLLERVFVCDGCQLEVGVHKKEIIQHINEPIHKNFLDSLKGMNGMKVKPPPKVESNKEKSAKKKFEPIKKRIDKPNLPKKLKAFVSGDFRPYIANSVKQGTIIKNMPLYGQLETTLLNLVKTEFPVAKIHFFGSRVSGLGTHNSDLDLFLEIGDVFNCYNESRTKTLLSLKSVFQMIQKQKAEWKNVIKIEDARVPIIRAFNAPLKIECDIAFSNGLAICNTRLLKYFCELQPIFQKMCFFLKKWLDLTLLSKQVTTYAVILLVVFYLQTKKILPTIQSLQKDLTNHLEIGPWIGNFTEKSLTELELVLEPDTDVNFYKHLRKFFNYYPNLAFQNLIVCPYLGKLIDKQNFTTFEDAMPRYFHYNNKDSKNNGLQIDKPMCIQDPFEQNHNVAKGISENLMGLLRRYMLLTAQDLTDKLDKSSF